MANYTTPIRESDHENEVKNNFDFNAANLACRVRIKLLKSIEDGHMLQAQRNRFKVKLLKHKLKRCSYEDSDVDMTNKRSLLRRRSFEPYELETIVGRITKHEEDHAKNIASLKGKLKRAR
ncbi:hypothetical protein DVH24_033978 [Malus domestica]|uniref:Uncharacterized protein n=1 Tax=Malus domestica TaxID=3750 RepID=A0A498KQH8_MALDO|nr:hypothetical protein DVH24_033978 [Malus domestica]